MEEKQQYSIQEAAKLSGLPESTLRYYEKMEIIPPIERDSSSGHRVYDDDDIDILMAAACLAATGMSIEEMRQYMDNAANGGHSSREQIELLKDRQQELRKEEKRIKLQQKYIKVKISYWEAVAAEDDEEIDRITKKANIIANELKDYR